MKKPLVLLVDDEREFLDAVKAGLEDKGCKVITCEGALQGLEILAKTIPDVIIADLRMQPLNGFEFYQRVKKMEECKNIPFFFLTGMKDELAEKYGLTLGVEEYFLKPVDLDVLIEAVKKAVAK
jgi:CheY-like chemotaxis protein